MKRSLLLILLAIGFTASSSTAQWSEIPQLPVELNWPMTAMFNGTVYAFGGLTSASNAVSNAVYTYTPGDAAWKKLTVAMPIGKFAGYAGIVGGKIYLVGGSISTGVEGTTYAFDPVAATFTAKKAIPTKTSFFAGAAINGKIYVVNGSLGSFTGNDVNLVQIYDPTADTWTNAGTTPSFTSRLSASAVVNGNIYISGGLITNAGFYTGKTWKGVPSSTDVAWTEVSAIPFVAAQMTGGTAGGKFVVTGGRGPSSPANYANTYLYDEGSDMWTTSYGLPVVSTNSGNLVGTGNDIYLVGNYQNQRAFKFTLSTAQLPSAVLNVNTVLINANQNTTKQIFFGAENIGVVPLTVGVTIPDSIKSWLSASNQSVDPFQSISFTLKASAGTMAVGLYKGTVTIVTNDASHTNVPLNIALYVLPNSVVTQPTVAVLEEGTGDWCGYCPQGKEVAKSIKDTAATGSFIALEYHGGSTTEPNMIPAGQRLINDMKIQGYPNASIQRWYFPGETYQMTNRGVWPQYVHDVLVQQPDAPVSINITSYSFDPATRKVHAVIQMQRSLAMVYDASVTIRLTTVITESGVAGQQEDYRLPSPYWTDYTWDDIVRQMYPNEFGTKVSFPTPTTIDASLFKAGDKLVVPGDKIDVTVDFTAPTIPDTILDPANCSIVFIANVVKGSSTVGSILQAQERPLVGGLNAVNAGSVSDFSLGQNYPNPVVNDTKIGYSVDARTPVSITVHDVLGREVGSIVNTTKDAGTYSVNFDASKLSAGMYIYTMNAGGKTIERTMTVTK